MTPALPSILPSLQRIKFLTCTCWRASDQAAWSGNRGRGHRRCGLFKAPPLRLAQPPGSRLQFLEGGVTGEAFPMGGRNSSSVWMEGVPLLAGFKKAWPSSRHGGWGYVWVTWRLLVFGRVSAGSAPGEEEVTTRNTVVAAAAGSREEVGLASLAALSVPSSSFPGATMGSGKGTRGKWTSPAGPVRGERIPRCPISKGLLEKDVGIT